MTAVPIENIRNFAIIAHIDHGKSTLADRLIQLTGGLEAREMVEQVLDSMDIERERGITIKAQTVRLRLPGARRQGLYPQPDRHPRPRRLRLRGQPQPRRLRGLALVVDASQGVEAQTLANVYQAIDNNHEIVPILNKIDLPAAEPDKIKQQIEDVIGLDASDAIGISAKTGLNVPEVLEAIVHRLPPPKGDREAPLKALLVDSWYDVYLGVVVLVRIVDGVLRKDQRIRMMGTDAVYNVDRVGVFTPKLTPAEELGPGEIGFLTGSIERVVQTRVGDTITDDRKPVTDACPASGRRSRWCSADCSRSTPRNSKICARRGQAAPQRRELFLRDGDQRGARLRVPLRFPRPVAPRNHPGAAGARIQSRPDRDRAVGHLQDQAAQRRRDGDPQSGRQPDVMKIEEIQEPWIEAATILTPDEYLGSVLKLCEDRRGKQKELTYVGNRAMLKYDLPLDEVVFDFYDRLEIGFEGLRVVRLSPHLST